MFSRFGQNSFNGGFGFEGFNTASVNRDVELRLDLSFLEAALGAQKTVTYQRYEDCGACQGSGVAKGAKLQACKICRGSGQETRSRGGFILSTTCRNCEGTGRINPNPCTSCSGEGLKKVHKTIDVNIPSGISEDTLLSVPGAGNKQNGRPGDLLLQFRVHTSETSFSFLMLIQIGKSDKFERKRNDIYTKIKVDFIKAILGGTETVPTIFGDIELKIPPGTQPGDVKRVPGKGILNSKTGEKGHQFVTINVELPRLDFPDN